MASIIEGPDRPLVDQPVDAGNLTTRGLSFERRHVCVACSLTFKESEIRFYNGKPYGIPCGCANDIPRLMRKGKK
jgi:hypothetical protein